MLFETSSLSSIASVVMVRAAQFVAGTAPAFSAAPPELQSGRNFLVLGLPDVRFVNNSGLLGQVVLQVAH
jgi:hypothetical protein